MSGTPVRLSSWLRLIRWPNLLYIVVLYVLFRYCLINLLYSRLSLLPALPEYGFCLLLLSVLCISAGGYIINDYLDIEADRINKPEKVIVGGVISVNAALTGYYAFTLLGLVFGFAAAYVAGNLRLGLFHVLSVFLLLQYSRVWKRRVLIGNLVIAFLGALLVLLLAFFESELFAFSKDIFTKWFIGLLGYDAQWAMSPEAYMSGLAPTIMQYILPYSLFAFLLTLSREVVKTAEDIKGDQAAGYRTLPIVLGVGASRIAALLPLLLLIQMTVQFIGRQIMYGDIVAAVGGGIMVLLPTLYLVWRLWSATNKQHFRHISMLLKLIMCVGLIYLPYLATRLAKMSIEGTATGSRQPNIPPDEQIIDMKIDTIVRTGNVDSSLQEQPVFAPTTPPINNRFSTPPANDSSSTK